MGQEELFYFAALERFPKFGPVRLKKILAHFPDLKKAFYATADNLSAAGIEDAIAREFIIARHDIDPEKTWSDIAAEEINLISIRDADYPSLLKEIYDAPPLLYYRGEIRQEELALAVVGTRKFTHYGEQVAAKIVEGLVRNNITVVSGLALGIDAIAHQTALNNRGRTIAVLGTGLDKKSLYPTANRYLAQKIVENGGAVLTEFPLGTPPLRHNFPQRNRIISGLTLGTLVIEAGEKSGALITARAALDQNREVFAVPGNIYSPVSVGPNRLIKQGAKPIASAEEILEALDLVKITNYIENKKIIPPTGEEAAIIVHLSQEPRHVDELIRLTGITAPSLSGTLTLMEMKGLVKNIGGMQYILTK